MAAWALVVDDSRAMRSIIGRQLRELGFDVQEACNGREALERLQAGDLPTVALVDWNMPEMNGFELIQTVRADSRYDALRLMMVTTESEIDSIQRALEAGANEYLMKPFTKQAVQEKLLGMGLVPSET